MVLVWTDVLADGMAPDLQLDAGVLVQPGTSEISGPSFAVGAI